MNEFSYSPSWQVDHATFDCVEDRRFVEKVPKQGPDFVSYSIRILQDTPGGELGLTCRMPV